MPAMNDTNSSWRKIYGIAPQHGDKRSTDRYTSEDQINDYIENDVNILDEIPNSSADRPTKKI